MSVVKIEWPENKRLEFGAFLRIVLQFLPFSNLNYFFHFATVLLFHYLVESGIGYMLAIRENGENLKLTR